MNKQLKNKTICRAIGITFLFVLLNTILYSQQGVVHLTRDSLIQNDLGKPLYKYPFLFLPGDDLNRASPALKDTGWKRTTTAFGNTNPLPAWNGEGWFRLWISIDSSLFSQALALRINHDGASEIFIDGIKKAGLGKIGSSREEVSVIRAPYRLIPFQLNDSLPHLVAIHYSNFQAVFPDFQGFQVYIADYNRAHPVIETHNRLYGYMLISVAIFVTLGFVHLLMFLFYPKQKLNLYYCIFACLMAGGGWTVYLIDQTTSPLVQQVSETVHWTCNILGAYFSWILLYAVNNPLYKSRRAIIYGLLTLAFLPLLLIAKFIFALYAFILFFILLVSDGLWEVFKAYKKGKPNVWLIGLGMSIVLLFYLFAGSNIFRNWTNETYRILAMCYGILGLPICYSIYLALDFSRINKHLATRVMQVKELSAKALLQETEKRELVEAQAVRLEKTVKERTAEVQQQADKLREMDNIKSRFFINITHEFRTPLTLIMGAAQQLISANIHAAGNQKATIINRNAEKLLLLINELLDLGKLEAGRMTITDSPIDAAGLLRNLFHSFDSLASQKKIGLQFQSDLEELWIMTDRDKLEKIICNLISNAIKFTRQSGQVTVRLNTKEAALRTWLQLKIIDNGIGIPAAKMPYIFDRFYQVDASDTRSQEGTGIGLALTKELVALLDGNITVDSKENEGTIITVELPYIATPPDHYSPDLPTKTIPVIASTLPAQPPVVTDNNGELPLVLVIEDHEELRSFVQQSIAEKYRTLGAVNGTEGLQLAMTAIPDLVITDLMMPGMDGFQVCGELKKDERTSHIPVVMLTAKADLDSRIEGLESGADAYLAKPFHQRELLVQIGNLIILRKQLREKYSKDNQWLSNASTLPSIEKIFIERVRKSVEAHLDDEQYSVERLGEEIGMSRTQLHRKLKALINQTPGELIRVIRLERAFDLLKNNAGNVSEVAYMVGFGNPANFSTSFSRHFGFAPSEVVKSN